VNNKLKLFPIPTGDFKVWFDYIIEDERNAQALWDTNNPETGSYVDKISDYSNVPYDFITYSKINDVGIQWIRKYYLALCKELLGAVRAKYSTLPIPGAEVTLDGSELRSEAVAEKEALITQLRENLEQAGRSAQMEKKAEQAKNLHDSLQYVPVMIYVG
jgi:hypothetical protein